MRQAGLIGTATTLRAAIAVTLVALFVARWGLLCAASGLLAGGVAGATGRWIPLYFTVPRACDPRHVIRALQDFTKGIDDSRCDVVRIGEGGHAELLALTSTDQRPLWRTYRMLVTKLYKPEPI